MLGIVLIDKVSGVTSHDVVDTLRRRFGTRRVGHAGTLDPLASGLLVVAIGPATRFLQYLPLEPKEYVADVSFGHSTSTYDAEGEPVEVGPVPDDLESALDRVMPEYRGLIQQLPPIYSAVKMNGKPLYTYARRGESVERRPRTVHIDELSVLGVNPPQAKIRIRCSGGTYVRTLAHDLGVALGCGGYLTGLVRTKVGRFSLAEAIPADESKPEHLVSLQEALSPMPHLILQGESEKFARDGRVITLSPGEIPATELVVLLDSRGGIVGIGRVNGISVHPECVLPREVAGPL